MTDAGIARARGLLASEEDAVRRLELRDPRLEAVRRRVLAGERLDAEEGLACMETRDLFGLAALAHAVKRRLHGDFVGFVLNQQLNPTNVCFLACGFCDFAVRPGDARAYEMDREAILAAVSGAIREVHIVGGLHPEWDFERYLDVVRAVKAVRPEVQVKAYTAVEVDYFARKSRASLAEVLSTMREAGVETLPGGGAEVFSERVRRLLFPRKIGAERWLEVHRTAHEFGMPTGATLLYGHVETPAERVEHLLRLRRLQDETGGFRAFVPLAFQPGGEAERAAAPGQLAGRQRLPRTTTSALDDIRTVAASRLLLDNFPHVKAYWIMLGLATATCALTAGASDLDGTVRRERIAHAAGAVTPEELTRELLEATIRDAGAVPRERDALYRPVTPSARDGGAPVPVGARAGGLHA